MTVDYKAIDGHIKSHTKDPYLEFDYTRKVHGVNTTSKKRIPGVADFKTAVESF